LKSVIGGSLGSIAIIFASKVVKDLNFIEKAEGQE
jgi:hypothetical protein